MAPRFSPASLPAILIVLTFSPALPAQQPRLDLYGDPLPPGAVARMGTVRLRHSSETYAGAAAAAFSPDGKALASAAHDLTVRLWDPATGKELRRWELPQWHPTFLAFGPDSGTLVAFYNTGRLELWYTAGNEKPRPLLDGRASVVVASADGKRLAVAVGGGGKNALASEEVQILEVPSGKVLHKIAAMVGKYEKMTLSPGGSVLALPAQLPDKGKKGLHPGTLVWDVAVGKERCRIPEAPNGPQAFSADGSVLYGAHAKRGLAAWDTATGKELRRFAEDRVRTPHALALSPDGALLVGDYGTGESWGKVVFWDPVTGKELDSIDTHDYRLPTALFAPDGRTLLTVHHDPVLRLWDVATRKEKLVAAAHVGTVTALAFSPDGKQLASGSMDASVRLWEAATGKQQHLLAEGQVHESHITSVAYAPDGQQVLATAWRSTVTSAWDPQTGKAVELKIGMHQGHVKYRDTYPAVYSAVFSADGKYLLTSGRDDTTRLWDVRAAKELRPLLKERYAPLRFTPDGKAVIVWDEQHVEFQDVATGKVTAKYDFPNKIRAGHWRDLSPDGKRLLAYDDAWKLELWDLPTGRLVAAIEMVAIDRNSNHGNVVQFSPDGRMLAVGTYDGKVILVETLTGQRRAERKAHQGRIQALAFSADGRWLASGGADTTALVWDVLAMAAP